MRVDLKRLNILFFWQNLDVVLREKLDYEYFIFCLHQNCSVCVILWLLIQQLPGKNVMKNIWFKYAQKPKIVKTIKIFMGHVGKLEYMEGHSIYKKVKYYKLVI